LCLDMATANVLAAHLPMYVQLHGHAAALSQLDRQAATRLELSVSLSPQARCKTRMCWGWSRPCPTCRLHALSCRALRCCLCHVLLLNKQMISRSRACPRCGSTCACADSHH
jgi:hypothetical protein